MAMTQRERMIATVTGLAVAAFAADYFAITPYLTARAAVAKEIDDSADRLSKAERTFARQRKLEQAWKAMVSGGLRPDGGEAEQQMYDAVGAFARDAGVTLNTRDPQRLVRSDRVQVVRLRVSGTGNSAAVARLLSKIEKAEVPLKVEEMTLTAPQPGEDRLTITLTVSTIWIRPATAADDKARQQTPVRRAPAGETL